MAYVARTALGDRAKTQPKKKCQHRASQAATCASYTATLSLASVAQKSGQEENHEIQKLMTID